MSTPRISLQPYDSRWADEFVGESLAVADVLGGSLAAIHHIGSTAIPGLHAKPIIDILAITDDLTRLDEHPSRLGALGYEALGEFGIPGRRYFRKNNSAGERTHQIHAFQSGSPQIARHLAFRDYLRTHPAAAHDYNTLKHRLAQAHPSDIGAYTDGKDVFIHDIDLRAEAWLAESRHLKAST